MITLDYIIYTFCNSILICILRFTCISLDETVKIYISQLIRYSGAYSSYQNFLDIGLMLTRKILNQRFLMVKLKSLLRKLNSRHCDLVNRYGISMSQITTGVFHLS